MFSAEIRKHLAHAVIALLVTWEAHYAFAFRVGHFDFIAVWGVGECSALAFAHLETIFTLLALDVTVAGVVFTND